jgi:predicted acylesterase/phospholipase RssA
MATDLRRQIQPGFIKTIWHMIKNEQRGAMDPENAAKILEKHFYRPAWGEDPEKQNGPIQMHELPFTPKDHQKAPYAGEEFHPTRHNWLREHKVPMLVINATTVNTGHAWQFTPHWMGESPWAVHEVADGVPRLEWSWYDKTAGWQMELSRAVAASACVPFIFAPLELKQTYEPDVRVQLVDGGVHDNQGTVSLLAHNCNVVLVSDACGQLKLQEQPVAGLKGLGAYALRSMDTLMERVRLANFADLQARKLTGLLSGLMFLHMKAGLSGGTIRRKTSQSTYQIKRTALSPSGVRHDVQQALADLRTDLDVFTENESNALMACGYQMATHAAQRDLSHLQGLMAKEKLEQWPFKSMLKNITSLEEVSAFRAALLEELTAGSSVRM